MGYYTNKLTLNCKFGKKEVLFLMRYLQLNGAAFVHFWYVIGGSPRLLICHFKYFPVSV